ncbi:sensor histidine kinase [Alkalihalobacterium bogoriense]|uniref:sensor histidine kinase n=1 Tax=Alkalihalobacterium bogoriense TaxID=246272 RepID=UPI000478FF01|nr:HAMP domain-containing sensor histidine kinase [Alkalihalobacterium bogoriense]
MNIHKRFIIQFFVQLILIFTFFSFILVFVWAFIGYSIAKSEYTQDFSKADNYFFSDKISIQDDNVTFDHKLKEMTKNQNGWLLVVKGNGEVIGSYNTPYQYPTHFKESELAAIIFQNNSTPIEYTHWKLDETHQQPLLLLFGRKHTETILLNEVKSDIDWNNRQLNLSTQLTQFMDEEKAWVQLLNPVGKVEDEYGTDNQLSIYSIEDLVNLSGSPQVSVASYFNVETEQTIIVGISNSNLDSTTGVLKTIGNTLLIVPIMLFLLLIVGTFWYAHKFGIPLITMIKWIQNLGSGIYNHPYESSIYNKNGKLKRKYQMYKELIATLVQLTETLQQNEIDRRKMTKTREEWISGISHDLKTPLSSIAGYAKMLESKEYTWSEKETREFSGIISKKSAYMMDLLEDLTLSYRLKNKAFPIAKEIVDINEFLRRSIIHFINDPSNNHIKFAFSPYNGKALATIDPKWFQRIIDNLLANAINYNPSGTTIKVSIDIIEEHLMKITIEDDGIGMDIETLNKLFQRYYRGTNTNDTITGTGLGMTITKQLVQLHDGSIKVSSKPQEGTTIRIIFPV